MNSINLYLVVLLAFWGELAPVFGQKRPEKPGQCPGEQPGMAGICVVNCEDDWSCPGAQKCCGSCPRDCAIPVRERSGRCPIPPQVLQIWVQDRLLLPRLRALKEVHHQGQQPVLTFPEGSELAPGNFNQLSPCSFFLLLEPISLRFPFAICNK
ncbi:four-disulfide core domain 18-like [Podarcis lilfordi]|uniref:Four-disulfide core domain 18-like n=1 Tax=Podarcis lilfordi TaxID=74358 RepID=A0AA35KI84_9SAUR|nr:four-disulfide core domain 18-like [Podarcis lilfordi]